MLSQQVRRKFLEFFKQKGHRVVPSSPVVPHDDPTLLFTNAGMNQFKDVFLGKSARDYVRAASSQKCLRVGGKHNDLDNVGHTARHLTFFEMLGNFSFGDYFKEEAIAFAWEVTQSVFEFDPAKIWITVFREDDESFELWKKWVPEKRIVRMDEKDNFWAMGETGPCGPCSELYFDKGPAYGQAGSPKEDTEGTRFLEFWNLVFMQFNKDSSGVMHPLPKPSIDTGAGLERILSLKLGVDDVFQTDILRGLIAEIEQVSHKKYQAPTPAFHVIADHLRSLAFAIADGAQPSNIERGYVLRKLLRRAVRYGRMLGLERPFLADILPRLVSSMGQDFPELVKSEGRIAELLTLEEESFLRTLKRGGNILNQVIEKSTHQISGEDAFKLKDTYGLPLEEILLIAKDYGLQVNLEAYTLLEEEAKQRSKSARVSVKQEASQNLFQDYLETHPPCEFVGYETITSESKVTGLIVGSAFASSLQEGEKGMVLLNTTPFYAEKGGQVADTGTLTFGDGVFTVTGCQTPYPGIILHEGVVSKGVLSIGAPLTAQVNALLREQIQNNHTATHLLHYALQKVLGEHIKQAGSLVEADRLRFDFNHHKPLSQEELREVERIVNEKVRLSQAIDTYELSFEDVQKNPKIKQFFGDKYGAVVRVVDIDFSQELCGGTHTKNTGKIGLFRISKETSIAAGVRRIEALTGSYAEQFMYEQEDLLEKVSHLLKTPSPKVIEKVEHLLEEHKHLSASLKELQKQSLKALSQDLLSGVKQVGSVSYLTGSFSLSQEALTELLNQLAQKMTSYLIVLGNMQPDRCQLIAKVSSDLVQKGIHANVLIKEIAPFIEGSGGGKPEMAQAGGKNGKGIENALAHAVEWLKRHSS
ncbi:MAG: alanyl-tRNA synthetase [Chlamydiota bacterium]|jgi:alanyl-tRNA synthetase